MPEVRLLDFDTAGLGGSKVYLGFMNSDKPWPLRVHANWPMLQSHDTRLLAAIIDASQMARQDHR